MGENWIGRALPVLLGNFAENFSELVLALPANFQDSGRIVRSSSTLVMLNEQRAGKFQAAISRTKLQNELPPALLANAIG
jgi:hypothetical protein